MASEEQTLKETRPEQAVASELEQQASSLEDSEIDTETEAKQAEPGKRCAYEEYLRSQGLRPGANNQLPPVPLDAPADYEGPAFVPAPEEYEHEPDFPPEYYEEDDPLPVQPPKPVQQLYEVDVKAERATDRNPWETLHSQGLSKYADAFKLGKQKLPLPVMLYETSGLRHLPDAIASSSPEELKELGSHLLGNMLSESLLMGELAKQSVFDAKDHEERLRRMPRVFEAHRNSAALISAVKTLRGPAGVNIRASQVNVANGPQQVVNNQPSKPEKSNQAKRPPFLAK